MNLQLQGKRALVTAASSGLGRACAEALVREGVEVFICARDASRLAAAAKEIGAAGYRRADILQASDVEELVAGATDSLGGLDILVTNVGHPNRGRFSELSEAHWEQSHQSILMSVTKLIRLSWPSLARSPAGRIVNITAMTASEVISGRVLSGTYRAAMTSLAKYLADEAAEFQATVNNIAPGRILTRGESSPSRDWAAETIKAAADSVPLRRLGDPAEVGALCAFLCSTQAGYITGQTILVDGGLSRAIG
ncbi:SDR family oxidoreductase [Bradyrhizobium sp. CCGB12]|uniref:SDR family oxidoreductase n=1 Tax=Bradyrhizobium sp. CCGB12 TaxID=2949632 RepID=UPI0020B3A0B5|nr:SDR family oxidoreductase [Bradyrhizobium sp. CCGB12]MCP3392285.1 SDR family oxidoreductase [Bradyrhizobium sp. CCGB12]